MGDAENSLPPSKKRAAGREITKDNPGLDDDEDSTEQEKGTFKRASDEVLANRRIVKVRRNQASSTPSANPFAGIRLVPPTVPATPPAAGTTEEVTSEKVPEDTKNKVCEETEKGNDPNSGQSEGKNVQSEAKTDEDVVSAENKENDVVTEATEPQVENEKPADDEKTENEKPAEDNKTDTEDKEGIGSENVDALSSFQQLSSSQNAFTGLAGTGFSTSTFAFGSLPKDGSSVGTGSLFGQKSDQPHFGFGISNNGSSSLFSASGSAATSKSEGSSFPSMQEVPIETGEENERVVFIADSALFEFLNGTWKERGKGEVKVNVSTTETERARLLMRARGNYRLILNASLYPDMKLTSMDKRGLTFACMNSTGENKDSLSTFALKFKDNYTVEEFRAAVTAHKSKTVTVLKTPENSPKASDE
uniref:Uncharacterized protein MANES_11G048200 n=1 Tax=Rhizophora mucronata TaxID=61149 RepID=A0A2P2K017_RHIMU